MIPMDRIIGKLDRLYEADDTAGAERLLLYWYEEAKAESDERGMLSLSGELMGWVFETFGERSYPLAFALMAGTYALAALLMSVSFFFTFRHDRISE